VWQTGDVLRLLLIFVATPVAAAAAPIDRPFRAADTPWSARTDRNLGPARDWALVTFPFDLLLTSLAGAPRFEVELRADLGGGIALGVRPMVSWYLPAVEGEAHGGGLGGSLVLAWYLERSLAGPFVAVQGGDLEAWLPDGRGRMAGGSVIFGYGASLQDGVLVNVGLGFGYWPRSGALDVGVQMPEVLSLRLEMGWGWNAGDGSARRGTNHRAATLNPSAWPAAPRRRSRPGSRGGPGAWRPVPGRSAP
jgi:hypothetical protein